MVIGVNTREEIELYEVKFTTSIDRSIVVRQHTEFTSAKGSEIVFLKDLSLFSLICSYRKHHVCCNGLHNRRRSATGVVEIVGSNNFPINSECCLNPQLIRLIEGDSFFPIFLKERDIREMMTCDAVYVLDGWEHSKGATFEVKTALGLGMKIYHTVDGEEVEITGKGMKFGTEKLRWDLVPWNEFKSVVSVLTTGANKYSDNNWQQVENAVQHYSRAMIGHAVDYVSGDKIDDGEGGSGESHLANMVCNALFLMWFDNREGVRGE